MRYGTGATVRIAGAGMSTQARRDLSPQEMATSTATEALADAGIRPCDLSAVIVSNALGGNLCEQGNIRGQSWLGHFGLGGVPVINVENACAGGINGMHLGSLAVSAGEGPVLVLGVEKMWVHERRAALAGLEEGVPAAERQAKRDGHGDNPSGSMFMGMNAEWARGYLDRTENTVVHLAAAARKAHFHGSLNPLAQHQKVVTMEEILEGPIVAAPLTRLMCSSFTDGAAAVVLSGDELVSAPRVISTSLRSGDGTLEYHERMTTAAELAWNDSGLGPCDFDIVEVHDASSAEELLALEALGFFAEGKAGAATLAGDTTIGGSGVIVNPSGGLVARGHAVGATGLTQVVELVRQLRGIAGERQVEGARLAVAVNTGGIITDDVASVGLVVLARD